MYACILNKSVIIYKYGGRPGRDCNVVSAFVIAKKCLFCFVDSTLTE
jgi:hypothetical protein